MKAIHLITFAVCTAFAACSNLPSDDAAPFKAYPNPYNPAAGNLTIEKLTGDYSVGHHDLIILDYGLAEIYRTTAIADSVTKKIYWAGIDNDGTRVAPGNYYIKVVTNTATGVEGANAMFKLIVQ